MRAFWARLEQLVENYGGFGFAALFLVSAVVSAVNHYRAYAELRDFGLPAQATWVRQRHLERGDDPDLYEVTFEYWIDDHYFQATQEGQEAYDLYGGPGEPVTILYSSNDPQQAQVDGTISPYLPSEVWLLCAFGLLMAVLSLWDLRKKRRDRTKP